MVGFIIDGRFGNCEMLLPVSSAIISIGHAAIQAGRDLIRRCGHVTPYVEQCVTKRQCETRLSPSETLSSIAIENRKLESLSAKLKLNKNRAWSFGQICFR
jgi:hypothetical protein